VEREQKDFADLAVTWRITAATGLLTRIADDASDPDNAGLADNLLTVIPLGWGNTVGNHGTVENWGGRINPDGSVDFPDR
jgi:hypothetical protein